MLQAKQQLIDYWRERKFVTDSRLLAAFGQVAREQFIPPQEHELAYQDTPQPIGFGQTISQPTTIIFMLGLLQLKTSDKVLEIGAGSGYNAALMAQIAKQVYSAEIIPELAALAKANLEKAKIAEVRVVIGDGSLGYPEAAPYDKIVATAACPKIPEPWIEQLKEGGIIVAPVGDQASQRMIRGVKRQGRMRYQSFDYFTFVPLRGKYGFN